MWTFDLSHFSHGIVYHPSSHLLCSAYTSFALILSEEYINSTAAFGPLHLLLEIVKWFLLVIQISTQSHPL
jgi:hypothetical protein